jgi:hypothetical protein
MMNKEKFLAGVPFRVNGIHQGKGSATFYYDECIMKQIRSGETDKVLVEDYHMNVQTVDDKWFLGFTFVMDKKVEVKYRYSKLVEFKEEA